ncbi:MAG: nuclear transport factor 2 family protein [Chloroflexota bacterium]|nr:nuclear transport factor 2 family protein [Chloroflexota bacterium]
MDGQMKATRPEDLTRLFVERANARDAEGVAALYEEDAIVAFPPGAVTRGRTAIQKLFENMLSGEVHFLQEEPLPTILLGDIALTATPAADEAGARAQVARRQADGTWLRILDRPDFRRALPSEGSAGSRS